MTVQSVDKSATKPSKATITKANGAAKPKAKKAAKPKPAKKAATKAKAAKPAKKAKPAVGRGADNPLLQLAVRNLDIEPDAFVAKAKAKGIKGSETHLRGVFLRAKVIIAAYKAR